LGGGKVHSETGWGHAWISPWICHWGFVITPGKHLGLPQHITEGMVITSTIVKTVALSSNYQHLEEYES